MDTDTQKQGTIDHRSITRGPVGKTEVRFLAQLGAKPTFGLHDAQAILGYKAVGSAKNFLERLHQKGWICRIRRDRYAIIPLSSGEDRSPQLHEFVVAMEMATPAAIAYWSALNHHGMTEQLPRTVFVATNHQVRRQPGTVLGVDYKVVALRPEKFFGIEQDWIGELPFKVTDREKTIVDGLDQPRYVGGIEEIVKALAGVWGRLDEVKLRSYAARIGNSAVAKRLGFIMEAVGIGNPATFHEEMRLAPGFSPLDPTLLHHGKHNRRWGLLVNVEVKP